MSTVTTTARALLLAASLVAAWGLNLGQSAVEGEEARLAVMRDCVNKYADGLDEISPGLGASIRSHPLQPARVSERHLVIEAGVGTTGTSSLNDALKILGLNAQHWTLFKGLESTIGRSMRIDNNCVHEVRHADYVSEVPADVDAVGDTPVAELFLDLLLAYPKARVVLTKRDSAEWVASRVRTHRNYILPIAEPCSALFGSDPESARIAERALPLHDSFVECLVPPSHLLSFNLWTEPKERLENLMVELATFLQVPATSATFPGGSRLNGTAVSFFSQVRRALDAGEEDKYA